MLATVAVGEVVAKRGLWRWLPNAAGAALMLAELRVRPAFAALPAAVLLTFAFRSFAHGVGADELSLLVMAQAIRDGTLPYETYWDVRPPLAYLWSLPSTFAGDATRAVATLRMAAWLAQVLAVWTFFCLFQRALGKAAAALGALALTVSANWTALHAMAMPNHFSMALSVLAFACAVAGRRGRGSAHYAGALIAGALPWMMVHAAPMSVALAVVAMLPGSAGPVMRRRLLWAATAALPTLAIVGTFLLGGHFDVLARTTFGAPLGVFEMRGAGGNRTFAVGDVWPIFAAAPWLVLPALAAVLGLVWLPATLRRAPPQSALRHAAFLVAPLALGFAAMAYAKPPAPPEYWIDMAPVMALLIAVAAARAGAWRGWAELKHPALAATLRAAAVASLAAALALPADPWRKPPQHLPNGYCRHAVAYWLSQLGPGETVLDVNGLCGFHLLDANAKLHPPFTFPPLWLRQLNQPWVGAALDGDGAETAAARRLRAALAPTSSAALILANGELLNAVRERGWESDMHRHWRMVWFRRVAGIETGERLARLAILKRRQ